MFQTLTCKRGFVQNLSSENEFYLNEHVQPFSHKSMTLPWTSLWNRSSQQIVSSLLDFQAVYRFPVIFRAKNFSANQIRVSRVGFLVDLPTSRAQIFLRTRSASGRCFMLSANRKWEAKGFEKVYISSKVTTTADDEELKVCPSFIGLSFNFRDIRI